MSTSDSTSPSTPLDSSDHNLQPFFVLRKASSLKPELKETRPQKTRRKIEVSHEKVVDSKPEVFDSKNHEELRLRAFNLTWSKIERTIEDVLRQINLSLFDGVLAWIFECFMGIKSMREEFQEDVTRAYPLVTDAICKQIPAAFILTRNMEFVDDLPTFQELGVYLRSNGCHVGSLSSLDFTAKQGVGGCLRSLLRQLLVVDSVTVDISALASWYNELKDHDKPIVVIIDDAEQCNGSVLAEFITMLSEWVIKIPAILVLGVATTVDVLRKLLPSDALQHLQPYQFTSESPQERKNSIIEAVLIKPCSGFIISHKVALFLKNYFLRHDGTITAFVKALKIACSEHFFIEPLSFLSYYLFDEDCKVFLDEKCKSLPSKLLDHAFYFPSCEGETVNEQTADKLLQGMLEIKKSRQCWSIVLMCLVEVGKLNKVQLLDIFCEAADPALYKHRASGHYLKFPTTTPTSLHDKKLSGLAKGGFILRAIHRIRDLPVATLLHILKVWESQTKEICEVHDKVRDLQSLLKATAGDMNLKRQPDNMCNRSTCRASSAGKETAKVNEKAALLMEAMIRDYLKPIEVIPFHEIFCFKHVDILQAALIGDPRRTVQVDLLQSRTYIRCCCCGKDGKATSPSMHDTSIVYTLAQEHGDLINLHDWYLSFKAIILSSTTKTKRKVHQSPKSKKSKALAVPADTNTTEAMIQARFCRAVTELQVTGLLRMPSKRRPDFVQRVAFGI